MNALPIQGTSTGAEADDRAMLRDAMRAYLGANWTDRELRASIVDAKLDPAVWERMNAALGIAGVLAPESDDGLGLGYREAMLLVEEAGAALYPGPLLSSSVLAMTALRGTDTAVTAALSRGEVTAAVALDDEGEATFAVSTADGDWQLFGTKTRVIGGLEADHLLVVASTPAGPCGLFAVQADAAGVSIEPLDAFDITRRMARVRLDGVAGQALLPDFRDGLEFLCDVGAVAAAAEQLGACDHLLAVAVDYSKIREQFGQPIGSFQAVRHLCADMLIRAECLRAAVYEAAAALDDDEPLVRSELASIAKAYGSEAAVFCAQTSIQILGGIGFTWEHEAHLYLRRAKTLQFLFGDANFHRERLARFGGLTGPSAG